MTGRETDDPDETGPPDETAKVRDLRPALAEPISVPASPQLRATWNADGPAITGSPAPVETVDFDTFFLQQWPRLTRMLIGRYRCERVLAEDIAQEAIFETLIRLPEVGNPEAYAYTVARRALQKRVERQKKEVDLFRKLAAGLAEFTQPYDETALDVLMRTVLTDRQREIVHCRFVENQKRQEIADQLGLSLRTVDYEIRESLGKLRPHFAPGQEES